MALILGIDPGSRITGFGLIRLQRDQIEHVMHGVIQMDAKDDFNTRICDLGMALKKILKTHRPDGVAVEKIFLGKNADSAFKLGHARGVLIYECQLAKIQVSEYATRVIKKTITGKGSAEKTDVQAYLEKFLGLSEIQSIDASDALAVAVHHAFQLQKPRAYVKAALEGDLL